MSEVITFFRWYFGRNRTDAWWDILLDFPLVMFVFLVALPALLFGPGLLGMAIGLTIHSIIDWAQS